MDLNHYFSADLSASATGDASTVDGITASQQRIIRRVLTNPGDYIWHPDYGCGAPQYIGETTAKLAELKARIVAQLALEPTVSRSPAPEVTLTTDRTTLTCTIKYVDFDSGTSQLLTFDTGAL